MNNTRLTITCEENQDGDYNVDVTYEKDYRTKFREAFVSVDAPMPIRLIEEKEINGESAEKSASVKIIKHISEVVGKSMKTETEFYRQGDRFVA